MKILIIDDEPLARKQVLRLLEPHTDVTVVGECSNGLEGIKSIQELKPELIFLDVQMPKITGFEMLELLEEQPAVIFTTAYDEYALKAFEANAIDYLLKPFGQERFDKALEKAKKMLSEDAKKAIAPIVAGEFLQRIVVKHQGNIKIIPVADILYLEAWDDYVKIHSHENVMVKKHTLTQYEKSLDAREFVRCHRSYLVNIKAISSIEAVSGDTWEVRLHNGKHIAASKAGYQKLKQILGI